VSNASAVVLLLSTVVGLMVAEAGTYRVLGWTWREALKAAVPSQVVGLALGVFVLMAFERVILRLHTSVVMMGLLGFGTAAAAGGAPLASWLAPEEARERHILWVSAGVKVLLVLFALSGLFLVGRVSMAAREEPPSPTPRRIHAPQRHIKDFANVDGY
jgi:hypothetical protein